MFDLQPQESREHTVNTHCLVLFSPNMPCPDPNSAAEAYVTQFLFQRKLGEDDFHGTSFVSII